MKYISVTSPGSHMSKPIFNYFDDYLVSLGEPATSKAWTLQQIARHMQKLVSEKPDDAGLYLDSGGFQIIVGYVTLSRIQEYIDSYQFALDRYSDDIDRIFSLDVWNDKLTDQEVYDLNAYSTTESIDLIKQTPAIADKQLFVMQTSNEMTFTTWKKLFTELEVYKHYKLWSIGGLVGLKKKTNARFSHAVPATLWLLTYQKHYDFTIDQVHWLGQSSRLSFLAMALMERLYGINMTSDSSQLVRFAALEHKLPYIVEKDGEFKLIGSIDDVKSEMIVNHSIPEARCYVNSRGSGQMKELIGGVNDDYQVFTKESWAIAQADDQQNDSHFEVTPLQFLEETGRLDNQTFIELQSQNLSADLKFGDFIADMIMDKGLDAFTDEQQLRDLHPILNRGRTALELMNNINIFKQFKDIVSNGDLAAADQIMLDIVRSPAYTK